MRHTIGNALLIILIVLGISANSLCAEEGRWYEHPKEHLTITQDTIRVTYIDPKDSANGWADVTIGFPLVVDAPNDVIKDTLNALITSCLMKYGNLPDGPTLKERANKRIEEFKVNRARYEAEGEHGMGWTTDIGADITFLDHGILSLAVGQRWMMDNAHPGSKSTTTHFDLSSYSEIRIADLFVKDYQTTLDSVGEIAFRKTMNLPMEKPLDSLGYFELRHGKFSPSDDFVINDSGLIFTYDAYEIAAYGKAPHKRSFLGQLSALSSNPMGRSAGYSSRTSLHASPRYAKAAGVGFQRLGLRDKNEANCFLPCNKRLDEIVQIS